MQRCAWVCVCVRGCICVCLGVHIALCVCPCVSYACAHVYVRLSMCMCVCSSVSACAQVGEGSRLFPRCTALTPVVGGPIPPDPRTFYDPSPDHAAPLLGAHHPEVTTRLGLPSWEVPPSAPEGLSPVCPPACGSSHTVAPSSLSDGRKERLLHAVSLAWALPPERPRNRPSRWSWQCRLCALPGQATPR